VEKRDVEDGCEGLCSTSEPGIRYTNRGNRGGKEVGNDMIHGTSSKGDGKLVDQSRFLRPDSCRQGVC
jgi:hypothetical protein